MIIETTLASPEEIRERTLADPSVRLTPRLHIVLEASEVPAFKKSIVDRALNTLDPWPPFAAELEKAIAEFVAKHCPSVAP